MSEQMKYIQNRIRLGWLFLGVGLVLGLTGIGLERIFYDSAYNLRIVTGLGILFAGLGLANLVRYAAARRDPQAARRLTIEERDERMLFLRARAGNRAYLVSAALAYILLMWVSFASNGSLPELSSDTLWWLLAGVVVIPVVVYMASLVYDQQHM